MMKHAQQRSSLAQAKASASSARYGYKEGTAAGIQQSHNTNKAGSLGKALARKNSDPAARPANPFARISSKGGTPISPMSPMQEVSPNKGASSGRFDFQQGRKPFQTELYDSGADPRRNFDSPQRSTFREASKGNSPPRSNFREPSKGDFSPQRSNFREASQDNYSPQRGNFRREASRDNFSPQGGNFRRDASQGTPQRSNFRDDSRDSRFYSKDSPQRDRSRPPSPGGEALVRTQSQRFGLSTPAVNAKGAGRGAPPSPGRWDDDRWGITAVMSESSGYPVKPARSPYDDISTNDTSYRGPTTMTMQRGEKPCQWDLMCPRRDKEYQGRISKIQLPMPEGSGKWVSPTRESDPRCASSMHGGWIHKEQDDLGTSVIRINEKRKAQLAEEEKKSAIMNCPFTDRYVRAQAGNAMKVLIAPEGDVHHLEPEIKSEKLDTSVRVAAGQVIQVDVGNKGKTPYVLQTEWPGVMAHSHTGSLTCFSGRLMYNRQMPSQNNPEDEKLSARGCAPQAKQGSQMHKSKSMQAVLQYIPYDGGVEEGGVVLRKALGNKRITTPNPDQIHPIVYGDGVQEKKLKDYNGPRTTHHFTYDGGVFQKSRDDKEIDEVEKKPLRKPGTFKDGFSDFSRWMNSKHDVNRYTDTFKSAKRAISAPPSGGGDDTDNVTHFEFGEGMKIDLGTKPPRPLPHLECSKGGMDVSLKHCTVEEVAIQREMRLAEDGKFHEKCLKLAEAHSTLRDVVKNNKPSVHHLASSGVASSLQWN